MLENLPYSSRRPLEQHLMYFLDAALFTKAMLVEQMLLIILEASLTLP